MSTEHVVNWGKPEIETKYKTETCFDAAMYADEDIVDFLKDDKYNFIFEIE